MTIVEEREGWTSRGKRRRQGRASAQVEQQRQSYLEVDRQDLYICLFKSQSFSHALWDGITMSNVMLGKLCHLSEHLPFHLKGQNRMLLGKVERVHTNTTVLDGTSGRPPVPHTVCGLSTVLVSEQWCIEILLRAPVSQTVVPFCPFQQILVLESVYIQILTKMHYFQNQKIFF